MTQPTRLWNRNFFLLWQGQTISRLGAQAFAIAMLFWIKHATESATLMGMLLMLSNLPAVILGPIGGTYADRHSRRAIILVTEALNGIAVLILAGLMFLAPDATDAILVGLFIVSFFGAVVSSFFAPAMSAAVPDLVPQDKMNAANSLGQFSAQMAVFIGQGIGGTLFRLLGAPMLFLINGVTYLFSAGSVLFITIPQTMPENSGDWKDQIAVFKQDFVHGFRYVWSKGGLRELVLASAFLSFFTVPVIVLLPFYVEDILKVSVDWYGFLLAAYGVGSVIGYVLAGVIRLVGTTRSKVMVGVIIVESAGYGVLGLVSHPIAALALAFMGGCAGGYFSILLTTLLQITTPSQIRGRVFGLLSTIAGSLAPIAMGLTGVVADLTDHNIPLIYVSCGVIMGVLSILVSLNRKFRNYLAFEQESTPAQKIEAQIASLD